MEKRYIVRTRLPVHDRLNLCQYGKALSKSTGQDFIQFDTMEEAETRGGRPCEECAKVRAEKNLQRLPWL